MEEGAWATPLGRVPIQDDLAMALLRACPYLVTDERAHEFEHSLEVEVPFLQIKNPSCAIVPLVVATLDLKSAHEVATALGGVIARWPEPVLLIVSTDMNHYESDEVTRKKDRYALSAIENLDETALAKAVKEFNITMCGFVPVYMLLAMKHALGLKKAALVDYRTSGDATGDRDRVVGYAGFIFN